MSAVSDNDGSSTITVTFKVGYPVDIAAVDVQNRVASAQGELPAIVNQAGITVSKKNPSILLGVTLYSPDGSVGLVDISNYAYLQVVDPLKRLPGVGDVTIFGERRYSMRIWLDPDKLAELGSTAPEIRAEMARLGKRFLPGLAWRIPYDTTMFVSASMHDVMVTLAEALALVIGVVFLFLQSWRTTIIPAIAIPVSLVFTLAAMLAMGFSLNMVTMLGMVLAIGLVVDDAIVVVENVERQLERGLSPVNAAVAAMKEVSGPIIAPSAALIAGFVRVSILPGLDGLRCHRFAPSDA